MSYVRSTHRTNPIHLLAAATMFTSMTLVAGHGRLMDPPARNSMWRLGFPNPVNYNDNELYCGGRVTQWARNKGKCGVCGDPYHNTIKDHEVGGKYANGIISREYTQGGTIEIIVHITANHKGYFEFRICPVEDPKVEVTQECLDTHLMTLANGEGSRFFLPEGKSNQFFNVSVQLPEDVTCKQCVVQWKYRTGNTWDKDDNGKFCVGCGPQEEFYNCADVTIHPRSGLTEVPQTRNSKPLVQNGGEGSGNNADLINKKEDIHFNSKKDNMNTQAGDIMSDYGRQKVRFLQKLGSNKYSSWNESKNNDGKNNYGSPFAHLARKSSDGSGREVRNETGPVHKDDGYRQSPIARVQPNQVSDYPRTSGVSDSNEVDRIRRRFGYSISSARDNHKKSVSKEIQGKTTQKVTGTSSNGRTTGPANNKNNHTNLSMRTSQVSKITLNPKRHLGVTAIPLDDTKLLRKDVIGFHKSPLDVVKGIRINKKESDSFLQKWKLQRLRRIAALRALQSLQTAGKNKVRFWHSTQSHKVTRPMIRTTRIPTRNSTTPIIFFTRPPQEAREFVKQRMDSNLYSSAVDAQTKSPKLQLDKKHSNKKNKLPGWLATALKFKESESDQDYKTSRRNNNLNKEIRQLAIKGNANSDLKNNLFRPQFTGVPYGYGDFPSLKRITDTKQTGQLAQEKPARLSKILASYDREDVDKHKEEDLSDLSNKDTQENVGTESLVRYIVSLLISQMKNDDSEDYPGKIAIQNKSMLGEISLSTMAPVITHLKDTTSRDYLWYAPGLVSASTTRQIPDSENIKDYKTKSSNIGTISMEPGVHQDAPRQHNNLLPSVRGDVSAFNGLILGSDYGNNQRLNKNPVEKYHNWRTAGHSDKHEDVKAQGTTKQTSLSSIKNSLPGTSNHVYQNKYNSEDYGNARSDKQRQETRLKPQVQESLQTPIDPHQLWSVRAERRRDHYNKQQEVGRPLLVCESLVVLSGGMDRWCTDNCNANFCPSSLCVCTVREPASSSRAVHVPLAIPRKHTRAHLKQHNPAAADEDIIQGLFTPIDAKPKNERYITAARTAITKSPQYSTQNNERSYRKPYRNRIFTQTPSMDNLNSFDHEINTDKMSLFLDNLLSQATSLLQQRADNMDQLKSTKTVSSYFPLPESTLESQKAVYTYDSLQQNGAQKQVNNHKIQEDYMNQPQTVRNDVNGRFQTLHQFPESSQRLNWYTRTNNYNLRNDNIPDLNQNNQGNRAGVLLQPYNSQNQIINNGPLSESAFSNTGIYNIQDTQAPIFYSKRPIYSQMPAARPGRPGRPGVITTEGQSRLTCKAIGAFAGVSHFDEWCLSTCLTTMCPLTVCSCEQRASHQSLSGR